MACWRSTTKEKRTTRSHLGGNVLHYPIKYSCSKHQINQARLLHATDITEEISSFGGTINSSLQQLYTGLSLGRPAGLIPSTSQAYLNCPSSSRNTEKRPSAQQHFHTEPYTNLLFCKLRFLRVQY